MKVNKTISLKHENIQYLKTIENASDFIDNLIDNIRTTVENRTEFELNKAKSQEAYDKWLIEHELQKQQRDYEVVKAMTQEEKDKLRAELEAKRLKERDDLL